MDTIEITLPHSQKVVEVRGYTTEADDEVSEQILFAGVEAEQQDDKQKISFPIANVMASQKCYVARLVKSIGGEPGNIKERLSELRSVDYKAVSEAVEKIVAEHSPKATEAKNVSKNSTLKK